MEEVVGFEPTEPFSSTVFKTVAIIHLYQTSKMVESSGLEPHTITRTSCLANSFSSSLNYFPKWVERWGSNPQQPASQAGTLPIELRTT